jgi:hypothetical protein
MQRGLWTTGLGILLLTGPGPARAQDEADLKKVVGRAVQAAGGAGPLAKMKAASSRLKGTFHGTGRSLAFTGLTAFQLPDRYRVEAEVQIDDRTYRSVQVVNGDQGWVALDGNVRPMTPTMLNEARAQLYVLSVVHLVGLTDKEVQLSALGETNVAGRAAVGVRVSRKGRRDVGLYFDKENGLLLKSETRARDIQGGDAEFVVETVYGDYRKVGGLQLAHRYTIRRDGRRFVEAEATAIKPAEKLDDSFFAKP